MILHSDSIVKNQRRANAFVRLRNHFSFDSIQLMIATGEPDFSHRIYLFNPEGIGAHLRNEIQHLIF